MGKHGGNNHYHATPRGTYSHTTSPAPTGVFARHTAVAYLGKHVGGSWNWNQEVLVADFPTPIAHAITTFFAPLGIAIASTPNGERTQLSLTREQCGAVELNVALQQNTRKESLAVQYGKLLKIGHERG